MTSTGFTGHLVVCDLCVCLSHTSAQANLSDTAWLCMFRDMCVYLSRHVAV